MYEMVLSNLDKFLTLKKLLLNEWMKMLYNKEQNVVRILSENLISNINLHEISFLYEISKKRQLMLFRILKKSHKNIGQVLDYGYSENDKV